jgi:F0F1-type ATP synthase delta subunit
MTTALLRMTHRKMKYQKIIKTQYFDLDWNRHVTSRTYEKMAYSARMEILNEIREVYKDIIINKYNNYKGVQTVDDLHLVLKSTQLSKEKRREIIELWREDPIYKLEQKYGKEMLQRVLQKKKDELCENEINKILSTLTNEEKIKLLEKI